MLIIENRTARSYVSLFVEIKPQRDRQTDGRTGKTIPITALSELMQ